MAKRNKKNKTEARVEEELNAMNALLRNTRLTEAQRREIMGEFYLDLRFDYDESSNDDE